MAKEKIKPSITILEMNEGMINPRVDLAFKKLFGVEGNKDLLISLLNSIISEEDQIDEIELLNPYNERNFKRDKLSVLDIKARNKHNGAHFLIEMQLAEEIEYHKRGLYSWARVYSNQLLSGGIYKDLTRTIAIHILNFTVIDYTKQGGWIKSEPNKYHHRFVLSDKETRLEVFKDIEIHTIELSKFEAIEAKDLAHVLPKIKSMLDKWVALLTKYELLNFKDLPKEINDFEIKKALKAMKEMNLTRNERELYDAHLDFLRVEEGAFRKRFIEGEAKGRAEGKAEEKVEIAKKMLKKGMSKSDISSLTGLSIPEIEELERIG
jgi:predicted transposase/invertase (TIGR01784 family)